MSLRKSLAIFMLAQASCIAQSPQLMAAQASTNCLQETKDQNNRFVHTPKYVKALELYNSKMYGMALAEFEKARKESNDYLSVLQIEGYIVLCKIHTGVTCVEKDIDTYCNEFPASTMMKDINYAYGCWLFDHNSYAESLKYLNRTASVDKEDMPDYKFRHAYCLMRVGEKDESIKEFEQLITSLKHGDGKSNNYLKASEYYLGYLYYSKQEFKKAIPYLESARNDQRFTQLAGYHVYECKFMLHDYAYVTKVGESLYKIMDEEYKPKVARMLSEAYYKEDNTDKAQQYFKLYQNSGVKLTASDNFYAGIMSYNLKMYDNAIDNFKKVIAQSEEPAYSNNKHLDSLVQSSYYFSGNSFIQLSDKYSARDAFYNASQMNDDKSISEDAYFNYAKLSFDLNRTVEPFNTYLKNYTYSQTKADEIYNYIATAFLLERNYSEALTALNKISNKTEYVNNNIQKASFLRGIQLVDNGGYSAAVPYFLDAADKGNNSDLANLSDFWLAECLFRGEKYNESLAQLSSLKANSKFKRSAEYPTAFFNSAYAQFKLGNYSQAIKDFNQFLYIAQDNDPLTVEAMERIADSYYMSRNYTKAAETYEKAGVIDSHKSLYSPYQASVCYGLVSQNDKKIALLKEITDKKYSRKQYYSQCMYELGRTLVQTAKDQEAIDVFNKLLSHRADSSYYYKSLLELGMIYSNNNNPDKALSYYNSIIEKSPSSEEAESALAGVETIYQQQNRSKDFIDYLDKIGMSEHKSAGERETIIYNSAEQEYVNGNYAKALNSFREFLQAYPQSNYLANANFYLAESYNKTGKPEEAVKGYQKVMEQGEGAFSELAALNYSELSYKLQKYENAMQGYSTLNHIAKLENNKLIALGGMMNCAFKLKDYNNAIKNAESILENYPKANKAVKEDAQYIQAKSYILSDNKAKGEKILAQLAKDYNSAKGAEANYLLIKSAYDSGKFGNVEKLVFEFSDTGSGQTYWLAKSFIILGDSYLDQDNTEQAEATYNSIQDNYTPEGKDDDVLQQLKMRFKRLNSVKSKK